MLVCRGNRLATGEPLILKFLKPHGVTGEKLAGFIREYELISRVDLPCMAKTYALEEHLGGLLMVVEDIGGESLDRLLLQGPISHTTFLELAIVLAESLGQLHSHRIIHKNINPSHIIWNPDSKRLNFIGFSIADEESERNVTTRHSLGSAGTLEYISPEQTGRVNRPVSYRTDFYSLGVTFYQMLTGRLPFKADDALGMVHCHIAGTPIAPHELDPAIPVMVSLIVMKLLAKEADERYQSASGLQADLERCFTELCETGTIAGFVLGLNDVSEHLCLSTRLYGREKETSQLLEAVERVREGDRELVLVAGYAGIGKTTLVNETRACIAEQGGLFIEGKFDQSRRNEPYLAWIHAFSGFIRHVLMKSDAQLTHWKHALQGVVGSIGRVLTEVIPDLELIIGPQPEVPTLGPTEARNRLHYVFMEFIQAMVTTAQPLVVFLDDLQWMDAASLNLLKTVLGSGRISNILVIGAYRDNEVDASHPLAEAVEDLRREQVRVAVMTLDNIPENSVDELIADTLRHKVSETFPLSRLIYSNTGGNPLFLLQTLSTLVDRKAVAFDIRSRRWEWDIAMLEEMEMADNVVVLMLGKIKQCTAETRYALTLASCIGFRFDVPSLSIIAEQPENEVVERLQPALREGLISPLAGSFQFAHDRIQQAALSLIPDEEKKHVHFRIAKLLLDHMMHGPNSEGFLFTIVDHLNLAVDLLETEEEKLEAARLNLRAGLKAKSTSAFSTAAGYFEAGVGLLYEDCWETDYSLALELHSRAAETASLGGDSEKTERLFRTIAGNVRTVVDRADAYESKMNCSILQGRLWEALDTALEFLSKMGLELPAYPSADDIARTVKETRSLYADLPVEELANLPAMVDEGKLAIVRIATKALAAAYISRPKLHLMLLLNNVNMSIRYGNTIESPHLYAAFAIILCGLLRDFDTGYRFGNLALTLLEATDNAPFRSKTLDVIGGHIWHYKQHLRTTLPYLERGHRSGLETGDLEYASYNACFYCCNSYFAGGNLKQLGQLMASYDETVRQMRVTAAYRILAPFIQAVTNLSNPSDNPCRFSGKSFDQETMLPVLEQTHNAPALAAFHVNRLVLCYLFEEYGQALESAASAEKYQHGMLAMITHGVFIFYSSLTEIQVYPQATSLEQVHILERVSRNQEELRRLADSAPMNFLHKFYLVEAERMRRAGEDMTALDYYDKAISLAKENEYVQEEALANELAAKFWLGKGKEEIARLYLEKAHRCYEQWGASGKVSDLKKRYATIWSFASPRETTGIIAEQLDLATLMKTAQAISGEIEMDRLLAKVVHSAIENAGAQCGFLLLERDAQWEIAAGGRIDGTDFHISQPASLPDSEAISPAVVHFVARTKEIVTLNNAAGEGGFTGDPIIRAGKSRSLLCAPLLSRGRLTGILYLENHLATNVFTSERVRLLEIILSQAATSLENAAVYEALKESEANYRQIVDTATEGIWVIAPDGVTTFVNSRMAEMLGCSDDEMIGRPVTDFLFEEDVPDQYRKMDSRRQGLSESYELRLCHKDDRIVWTNVSATPLFDANRRFKGGFAMFTDITLRKKREAQEQIRLRIFELLASGGDLTEILGQVVKYVENINTEFITITMLADVEGNFLSPSACSSRLPEEYLIALKKVRIGEGIALCGIAARRKETVIVEDLRSHFFEARGNQPERKAGLLSGWAEPIFSASGKVLGTLSIYRGQPQGPTGNEMEQVRSACHLAAIAIERSRSLDLLHEREQAFRALAENSPDSISRYDTDCRRIYVNPAIQELFGLPQSEILGKSPIELSPVPEADEYMQLLEKVRQNGGEVRREMKVRTPAGKIHWGDMRMVPEFGSDGKVSSILVVGRDITQSKHAEAALRESEARYRSLFEESIDGVFISSVAGKLIDISKTGARILGYATPKEMKGVDLADVLYGDPAERARVMAMIEEQAAAEQEVVMKKKNGDHILVRSSIVAIQDNEGKITGYQEVIRDITEEKRLEQELFKAKKMEIIGQLAGGVAHEVRNPLNAILFISEALFKEKQIAEREEFVPYIQHIRTQVGRLSKLMKDLLDLGRPIKPDMIQEISLVEVVQETVKLWNMTEQAAEHPLLLTINNAVKTLTVHADPTRLQQALLNLVENASQHSPRCSEIQLRICKPINGMITIQVRDNGNGIVPEKLMKIFEPFYTTRTGGTGLGLPLVKHFIEDMGGEISLWNNERMPGCTAEISFAIPGK